MRISARGALAAVALAAVAASAAAQDNDRDNDRDLLFSEYLLAVLAWIVFRPVVALGGIFSAA